MGSQIFYSNRIETLSHRFFEEIGESSIFNPPLILIPNPHLKKWIQMTMAKKYNIAMNMNFDFLDQGLFNTIVKGEKNQNKYELLTKTHIQLMLIHLFSTIDFKIKDLKPIHDYLFTSNSNDQTFDIKVWQLTEELTRYFNDYELYRTNMLNKWEENKIIYKTSMERAQKYLYNTLFNKGGFRDSSNENLVTLPQLFKKIDISKLNIDHELYLFGISQLSPFHVSLIYNIGITNSISLFMLNPCKEYWEDIRSPYEEKKIGEKLSDTNNYSQRWEGENHLLKLWGTPGRETIKLLSNLEEAGGAFETFESTWIDEIDEEKNSSESVLGVVQNQILHRTEAKNHEKIEQDTSIQIVSCPHIYTEVNAVFNSILHNLQNLNDLSMNDIAVIVPDMERYSPIIYSVFNGAPRRISYSIIDSNATSESIFGNALIEILSLPKGNFSRKDIFSIIFNPCFLKAIDYTIEDAKTWLNFADNLNVFHHFDTENKDEENNYYTWNYALKRLRLGRIMDPEEDIGKGTFNNYMNLVPPQEGGTKDPVIIGQFSYTIEQLYKKVKNLYNLKKTGHEWIETIEDIISEFIAIPDDRGEEFSVLQNLRFAMRDLTIHDKHGKKYLTMNFVLQFLKSNLQGISCSHGIYLSSGINISALVPKRQIPFKIIYILGMEEGLFPGNPDQSTLNLMTLNKMPGDITRQDGDKYLFLETLISAREKLYITFVSKDLQKDQYYNLNSVGGQLLSYLEKNILKKPFLINDLPFTPYFSDEGKILPSSYSDLFAFWNKESIHILNYSSFQKKMIIEKLYHNDQKKIQHYIKQQKESPKLDFSVNNELNSTDQNIIKRDIKITDLKSFLLNPVEAILKSHLGIFDDYEKNILSYENPFFSVAPFNLNIIFDSLKFFINHGDNEKTQNFIDNYYNHYEVQGKTPSGSFSEIEKSKIKEYLQNRIEHPKNGNNLDHFLKNRKGYNFYNTIACGEFFGTEGPEKFFEPVPIISNSSNEIINIHGSLQYLWKNDTNTETLVIALGKDIKPHHLLNPFLFFLTAISGFNTNLKEFCGNETFTINIASEVALESFEYTISQEKAQEYLTKLVTAFSDKESFYLLPFKIITEGAMLKMLPLDESVEPDVKTEYRSTLIQAIESDLDSNFGTFNPMDLLSLINPEVPKNAYDIIAAWYPPILKPYLEKNIK